jgi:hypothetical protein
MTEPKKPKLLPELKLPTDYKLRKLVRDLKLDDAGAHNLNIALQHAKEDIEQRNRVIASRPNANVIRRCYKDFDKAIENLEKLIKRHADKGTYLLPNAVLETIGALLSDKALRIVTDPTPRAGAAGSFEDYEREALGLKHGPQLLAHFVGQIHAPLQQWLQEDKTYRGGRPAGATRELVILSLAEHAPSIIGKKASASPTSSFVTLCNDVFEVCTLKTDGLEKLIERTLARRKALIKAGAPRPRGSRSAQ